MNEFTLFWVWLLSFLLVNSIFSIPVAYVATQKGRSGAGFFFLSFFLSFLVGILVVLALPKKELTPIISSGTGQFARSGNEQLVKCPFCAEWVKTEAKVCKHCGRDIAADVQSLLKIETEFDAEVEQTQLEQKAAAARHKVEQAQARKDFFLNKKVIIFFSAAFVVLIGAIFSIVTLSNAEAAKVAAEEERKSSLEYIASQCLPIGAIENGDAILSEDGKSLSLLIDTFDNSEIDCISNKLVGLPLGTKQYSELPSGWEGTEEYDSVSVLYQPTDSIQIAFKTQ